MLKKNYPRSYARSMQKAYDVYVFKKFSVYISIDLLILFLPSVIG